MISKPMDPGPTNQWVFHPPLRHTWEAFPLLGSSGAPRQAKPSASLKCQGPLGPQCIPTAVICCQQDQVDSPKTKHKWAGTTQATQGGPVPGSPSVWILPPGLCTAGRSALIGQAGGGSLSSGDPRRSCIHKSALQVLPACPEWTLPYPREVVERELGMGRRQEHTVRPPTWPGKVLFSGNHVLPLEMSERSGAGICEKP